MRKEREEEVFTARIGPELDRGRGDREHLSRCWNHQRNFDLELKILKNIF